METKMTFEKSMERLKEIVEGLENNELDLSKAMVLFEEGLKLVDSCEKELKGFDEQINTLIKKHSGE